MKALSAVAIGFGLASCAGCLGVGTRPDLPTLISTMSFVASGLGALLAILAVFRLRSLSPEAQPSRAFSRVGRLLPARVRDEYCEEWAAWMADLRADGTPRVRLWLELLSLVLIAVPRLAIGLRWAAARRAVDR